MRPCFTFTAKSDTKPAVLAIDDEIGFWGVQARDFRSHLDKVDGALRVEINSPGGDVFAGLGMYNMLRSHAAKGHEVTTVATGVVASIASIVMLAGDKREMPANAFAMIHGASSGIFGTEEEIREHADVVGKINASLRQIYMDRMGVDEAGAAAIMSKDTWFTAQECVEQGFATAVTDAVEATAKFDLKRADLPEHVAQMFTAKAEQAADVPAEETPAAAEAAPEVTAEAAEAALEEQLQLVPETPVAEAIVAAAETVGLKAYGVHFAMHCDTLEQARERMVAAREIVALCTVAGRTADAAKHIRANAKPADVRAALIEALADSDVHVETAPRNWISATHGGSAKPASVNTASIWASHNAQLKKKGH